MLWLPSAVHQCNFTESHLNRICNNELTEIPVNGRKLLSFSGNSLDNPPLCWDQSISLLLERQEYHRLFDQIMTIFKLEDARKSVIVKGTPGIGKSMFGWWLVYKLLQQRKLNHGKIKILFFTLTVDPILLSVDDSSGLRSISSGINVYEADYVIIDSVSTENYRNAGTRRIFISSVGNDHLKSAISNWNLKHLTSHYLTMDPFSEDDIMTFSFKHEVSTKNYVPKTVLAYLYDISGGNARMIFNIIHNLFNDKASNPSLTNRAKIIYNFMLEFFHLEENQLLVPVETTDASSLLPVAATSSDFPTEVLMSQAEDVPTLSMGSSSNQQQSSTTIESRWHDITLYDVFTSAATQIDEVLSLGKKRPYNDMNLGNTNLVPEVITSSVFQHNYHDGERDRWASPFMTEFAGYIHINQNENMFTKLKEILSNCGIGGIHEYMSHRAIFSTLAKKDGCFWITPIGSNSTENVREKLQIQTPLCRTRMIRTIADLNSLKEGEYGKPSVPNFALIDSAIKVEAYTFQMTIARTHDKQNQNENFTKILNSLGASSLSIVFVLDKNNFNTFKPLEDLPTFVKQYKMCSTEEPPKLINNFTRDNLVQMARKAGLNVNGSKQVLWKRLKDADIV